MVGDVLAGMEGPDSTFYAISCLQAGDKFNGSEVSKLLRYE